MTEYGRSVSGVA